MTVSEFAFLALGLVLGIACGAAIVEVRRGRPRASREVRVTVAPGSVPKRRSTTLAEDAFAGLPQPPARGGPADRDMNPMPILHHDEIRTSVLSGPHIALPSTATDRDAVAIPIHAETDWALASLRQTAAQTAERAIAEQRLTIAALLDRPATAARGSGGGGSGSSLGANSSVTTAAAIGHGGDGMPTASTTDLGAGQTVLAPSNGGDAASPTDGCAEHRRVADERCTIATRAREQAGSAHDALRAAQRAYDDHHNRAEQAAAEADPRQMRDAKEAAQSAFRHARTAATTREAIEAAARDWLTEINRINHGARDAAQLVQRERDAANALVAQVERLTVEADAARISAENAETACVAARQAVADCQEALAAPLQATLAPQSSNDSGLGLPPAELPGDERELEVAFRSRAEGEPAILRLVRGDHEVLLALADALGGEDDADRQRWRRILAHFVEAVTAAAIEATTLTFPIEHPFWGAFSLAQNREIMGALSSLGYRFDAMGGWVDERTPGQRDLSLAVGYAGQDPMRVRRWPNESESAELLQDVAVAADEYLIDRAAGLTLGELIGTLGRRADELAELWNDWGRARPLLLAEI